MTGRLEGRVAIVTGAAAGMGAATVKLFASEGAVVVAVDLPTERNDKAVAALHPQPGRIHFVGGDVSLRGTVEAFVAKAVALGGRVDILFNNAGYYLPHSIEETTEDDYDRLLDVNLKAVYLACKAVLPLMKAQRHGVILSTASNAGLVGRPMGAIYGAAKAGVVLLTKSLALSAGPDGVRVNCICPGTMRTAMFESGLGNTPHLDEAVRNFSDSVALRRLGTAEDVAQAALFLSSDAAAYITGVALPVDGGRVAGVQEPRPLGAPAQG